MNEHYPFELSKLPYSYDALEPCIDKETIEIHHNKHMRAYVDKLNEVLADYPQYHNWTLEQLIMQCMMLPQKIRTKVFVSAGGIYNHEMYFDSLAEFDKSSCNKNMPNGKLLAAIEKSFCSFERFKEDIKAEAMSLVGSGYVWLVSNRCGGLKIISTCNQDTPLCLGCCKILAIDVWEHAYYLKHLNRRDKYIDNIFAILNWDWASGNYVKCIECMPF